MLRFEHLVDYDCDSPEDADAPLTDNEAMKALGRFRGDLHGDILAANPKATTEALLTKSNRTAARTIAVKTTLDAGTLDEAVQRWALRHRLNANLLRCT
jgi:hypothetical protein